MAADLLSQAEHGVDSQVVLVAVDLPQSILSDVESQVDVQARALERVDIVRESVSRSIIVQVANVDAALEFSNDYAPEHLILHIKHAADAVARVQNAGSVFVGPFSPERQVYVRFLTPNVALMMVDGYLPCRALLVAVGTTHREQIIHCQRMDMHANIVV